MLFLTYLKGTQGVSMKYLLLLILTTLALAKTDILYTGYVPTYRMGTLNDLDYENLTHVFAAFGNPDSSGSMSIATNIDNFVATVTANGRTKALLSIGGGGSYSWGVDTTIYSHLFADTNRTMFVDSIITYLEHHNLDGLDADIEGTALEHENYDLFLNELADSLTAHNLLLTAALGASSWGGAGNLDDSTLLRFDFIMTMSYGGTWTSKDLATYNKMVEDMHYFIGRGVPKKKIVGGVPFYAVSYNPDGYLTLSQLYTQTKYLEQDPFYTDTLKTEDGGDIYLNSWPTIKKKFEFSMDSGYGGIMIWELGQDNYSGSGLCMSDTIAYFLDPTTPLTPQGAPQQKSVSALSEASTIAVYDILGRKVAQYTAQQSLQTQLQAILPQGIYILQYQKVGVILGVEKLHIK